MIRAILFLIGFLLFVSVARSVLTIIGKGLTGMGKVDHQAPATPASNSAGELKKDPVCGTFISTATAFQKFARGETHYFCSPKCRDEFTA